MDDRWDLANTIYTIIEHREEGDTWRESIMSILGLVFEDGYRIGWEEGVLEARS